MSNQNGVLETGQGATGAAGCRAMPGGRAMRPSLMEISSEVCHYCGGSGYLQSVEWTGLHVLRAVEEEALRAFGLLLNKPARHTALRIPLPAQLRRYGPSTHPTTATRLIGSTAHTLEGAEAKPVVVKLELDGVLAGRERV